MKAICITNRNHDTPEKNGGNAILTIGKVYDLRSHYFLTNEYSVYQESSHSVNGVSFKVGIPKSKFLEHFKLIDEYRQEQIEKILE